MYTFQMINNHKNKNVFFKYVNDGISKISFDGNNCILCGPFKGVFAHAKIFNGTIYFISSRIPTQIKS